MKKMITIILLGVVLSSTVLSVTYAAPSSMPIHYIAATQIDCSDPSQADNDQCSITKSILIPIINILSMAVGIVVTLSVVVAGIMYITANGNSQQVVQAKNRIFNSILALVVYIFGFALLQWLIPGGIFSK